MGCELRGEVGGGTEGAWRVPRTRRRRAASAVLTLIPHTGP